jgi:DNA-binding CsgD family transcriptional regulator
MRTTTRSRSVPARALLERDEALAMLRGMFSEVRAGSGRMVLVAGEAGVGKTALVTAFRDASGGASRVLEGSCDALATPRPLAPFTEMGGVSAHAADGITAHELFEVLRADLTGPASLIILEDVHWADGATLDVLRVLGRRVESLPALVIVTYRDDGDPQHPLRLVLGDLGRAHGLVRFELEPLSVAAVTDLAAGHEVAPAELHRRTGGNPFYVHEVLDAGSPDVPPTVSDAVMARAARLSDDGLTVLETVSVAPPEVDLATLEQVCGPAGAAVDECLSAGMLDEQHGAVAFRHELAREAVESSLGPARRRAVHRAMLSTLAASPDPDPARLAHHAEGARDAAAVLEYAPQAAHRAASLGAYREAAAQYARALRFAAGLSPQQRAGMLSSQAEAFYKTDDQVASIAARDRAISEYRDCGDVSGEGAELARVVSAYACRGIMDDAHTSADRAVELLEPIGEPRGLGLAYGAKALLALYGNDLDAAVEWGRRSVERALAAGDDETAVDAMITAGTAELLRDGPDAAGTLTHALAEARRLGLTEAVARACNDIAFPAVYHHAFELADEHIEQGLAHCERYDLDLWTLSLLSVQARSHLNQGRFDAAGEVAARLAADLHDSPTPRLAGLEVLALVRARRGDPGVHDAIDRAMAIDYPADEIDWAGPLAAARAEIAWLEGQAAAIGEITDPAFELALLPASDAWIRGELAVWRYRAGLVDDLRGAPVAEPWGLELADRNVEAAAAWDRLGRPYEAAVALATGGVDGLTEAHERLRALGAQGAAAVVARRLREHGVRGIVRGPRPATLENPANLTAREVEVLALVADGLTNAEIALRLHLSVRTVDHHVSRILRKLDVPTRARAGREAARLGISSIVP